MAERRQIFVFGSNLEGRHCAGSALEALKNHGAIMGRGEGLQGNSYAIPTKAHFKKVLSLIEVRNHVMLFLVVAESMPECTFNVVKIGCGLAGFTEDQIAPMFKVAPANVNLPDGWREKGKSR